MEPITLIWHFVFTVFFSLATAREATSRIYVSAIQCDKCVSGVCHMSHTVLGVGRKAVNGAGTVSVIQEFRV